MLAVLVALDGGDNCLTGVQHAAAAAHYCGNSGHAAVPVMWVMNYGQGRVVLAHRRRAGALVS
jgi:hypothetical protein